MSANANTGRDVEGLGRTGFCPLLHFSRFGPPNLLWLECPINFLTLPACKIGAPGAQAPPPSFLSPFDSRES